MTSVDFSKRGPFERLFDALVDPSRRGRVVALLLCGYAAAWWLYAVISNSSQDIHVDMDEMFAWSHQVTLGTPKHPPLATWLVRAWFSVMPIRPWAYYLFAVISATVALWIAWRISARYLSAEKRVVGLVLLTFVPFYNFHALRFNANAVLIPFWALTTWFFLRSFETRRAGWARSPARAPRRQCWENIGRFSSSPDSLLPRWPIRAAAPICVPRRPG